MKCEKCGKNEATTYYKETINGNTREMHLCSDCAREMHIGADFQNAFAGMENTMAGLWGHPFPSLFGSSLGSLWDDGMAGLPSASAAAATERKCPNCGMTESELRRTGRAGCPQCYNTFSDILTPYIRQVHGTDTHLGAKPKTETQKEQDPVAEMKSKLEEAIKAENYEEAARLRDEIRRLEGEQK